MTTATRTPAQRLASLTEPQRAALAVIHEWGSARISNRTDPSIGAIYWRTHGALVRAGLATSKRAYPGGALVELTALGETVAAELPTR